MDTTADNKAVIRLSKGANVVVSPDGETITITKGNIININFEPSTASNTQDFNRRFPIVPASQLSLKDDFMKHEPGTDKQKRFKTRLIKAIQKGLKDFRVSAMDPSFDTKDRFNNIDKIVYEEGNRPAVNKSGVWWKDNLKKVMPKEGSRMGTKTEYVAFCGYIIKYLVSIGWEVGKAWRAVCDDSQSLGHYWNSENAKKFYLEPTGSRPVGVFYDLANTRKILEDDDLDVLVGPAPGFVLAGGYYHDNSEVYPLATLYPLIHEDANDFRCVGWLVLPA